MAAAPALQLAARLRARDAIDPARMPALALAIEALSSELSMRLSALCGTPATAILHSALPVGSDEHVAAEARSVRTIYRIGDGNMQALVCFSVDALHRVVDVMFGGDGSEIDSSHERSLSALELRVCRRCCDIAMDVAADMIGGGVTTPREWLREEIVGVDDACQGQWLAIRHDLSFQTATVALYIFLPQRALSHLKAQGETAAPASLAADPSWTDVMRTEAGRTEIVLQAALAESSLAIADLARLRVGAVLPLRSSPRSAVHLVCEGRTIFQGRLGQRDGAYTVRIGDVSSTDVAQNGSDIRDADNAG